MVYKIPPGGGGKPYLASGLYSFSIYRFFLHASYQTNLKSDLLTHDQYQ